MKNIIVVTGGAGFIGSNLIEYLLKKTNLKIISIDNYSTGKTKNHIDHKNVMYIKGENINISKILKKFKKKIKVIFHFGEFSRIFQSFIRPKECLNSNINNSFEVINFANENKIQIIYSATSSALGNNGKDQNQSPYAWAKTKNIELIKNYSEWFNLKYELVFFYNVYGPKQITDSPMSALIGIFESQYKKKIPLSIVKPGSQRRDFTHVDDIVHGCYLAWTRGKQNEYMLCTNKSYSILEIAKMFGSKIKFLKSRPGDRFGSIKSNNNAKKILGFTTKKDIKNYIKDFVSKN
ncbi:NAD-dependent epimerase/dehydratase family protein [Candidatus Pelagibacter sp.]|nr:NAD-dependent epimerase/dehydratase family protein [Candidatus Pelagibacter sp.]MDB4812431.1 NAD-dependent epimerase/dehydratase family protein [Candidatus Pelagibacter sp.]